MKNILVAISVASLVGGSVASAAVRAESQGRSEKTHYQYATVLSAKPIKEIFVRSEPQQECWQEPVVEHHRNQGSHTSTLLGGLIGAAVGNKLGHRKQNKKVGAVAGALLGASIGHDIGRNRASASSYSEQTQCRTVYRSVEEERVVGYRVRYRFNGETYSTQTPQHPGDSLRLRITHEPAFY